MNSKAANLRYTNSTCPKAPRALEVRRENRVGNPMIALLTNAFLPDPGGVLSGQRDAYGNDGGPCVSMPPGVSASTS